MSRVLIVDDDRVFTASAREFLQDHGIEAAVSETAAQAIQAASSLDFSVAVVDQRLPDGDGAELCRKLLGIAPEMRIIFATAYPSYQLARKAVQLGAFDYLAKPFEPEELLLAVRRALEFAALQRTAQSYRELVQRQFAKGLVLSEQQTLREARALAERAAATEAPVLLVGETGTGKGLFARYIHAKSPRSQGPFIAVNCAGVPESLFEAEFFGHEKGAFTGASASRPGFFEQASGGTLFLDEIAELPVACQAKLLVALEERKVRRLGSRRETPVDVRLIAATNRDLHEALTTGALRQDLYFRLSVVVIALPPLRQRLADLPTLVPALLREICGVGEPPPLAEQEWEALYRYSWPGNIRELRNVLERAWILQGGQGPLRVTPFLGPPLATQQPSEPSAANDALLPLEEVIQRHVREVLQATGGNFSRAARILGVSLSTLKRWSKKFRLPKHASPPSPHRVPGTSPGAK
jgi:DNA-binding NtrC family response regulator